MVVRFLYALMVAVAAGGWAAPPSDTLPFNPSALAGWAPVEKAATVPYRAESLASEFLYGARSAQGSYAFITRIDNTLKRMALSPEELLTLVSSESFAGLRPRDFEHQITEASLPEGGPLPCVVVSFHTRNLGYDAGTGLPGEALVKTVFLPMVLWDRRSGTYWNHIYVVNFRGASERVQDVADFDQLWRRVTIPEGLSIVAAERFNALQPELAQGAGLPQAVSRDTAKESPVASEPDTEALAGSLLARLSGSGMEKSTALLRRAVAAHPETVLAGVVAQLDGESVFEQQKAVWERALATADGTAAKARLAALFLASSLETRDLRMAETTSMGALSVKLTLADLDSRSLADLVEALLRQPPSPLWPGPGLRRFLALDARVLSERLRPLLLQRGIDVPDLQAIAHLDRKGRWRLKDGRNPIDIPSLATVGGKLVLVRRLESDGRDELAVREVNSLLQLAEVTP